MGFSQVVSERLRGLGSLRLADLDRDELLTEIRDVDVLWVRLRHRIDEEVLEAGQRLRAIVTPTTGIDHIDTDAAERRGVKILSLRGEGERLVDVRATAEHTLGLMLAMLRHLRPAVEHVETGGWDRDLFWGTELYGKTVGVVGYGRLGRLVARYLGAFEARVLATDRPEAPEAKFDEWVEPRSLDELLAESDIVSLHTSLDRSKYGFFGRAQFELMRPSAWFVNTARGPLVDEDALLEALETGRIAGAALDVLADEQGTGSHRLVDYARVHPNLIITPHIGGATLESREKTERLVADQLTDFLRGDPKS